MNKLEEIVKSTTGETRKALDELVHALASSIQENKKLTQEEDYEALLPWVLQARLSECNA